MKGARTSAKLYAAYVALVLYLCLFPWAARAGAPGPWFAWVWVGGRTGVADIVLNAAFYVPLGLLGWLAFRRFHPVPTSILTGVLLSSFVEFAQGWLPGRVSSSIDLLANAAGAVAGAVLAPWVLYFAPQGMSRLRPARLSAPAALLVISFAAGQAFPFIPRYRLPHLRDALAAAADIGDPLRTALAFVLFAAAAYWLRFSAQPAMRRDLCFALMWAFLMLRPFFPGATFTGGEWFAAFAGSAAGAVLPAALVERALFLLLPLLLIVEAFRPFHFTAAPVDFGWVPFRAVFDIAPAAAIRFFAGKFFFYAATISAVARRGVPRAVSAAGVISILAVAEAAQRYLPGRTPESTDLVLALAAWAALSLPGSAASARPPKPTAF